MTGRSFKCAPVEGQRGYALLMVIFLVATLMIFALAGSLSIQTQGRREKEAELAWRGEQYVRAIRLFFKKNGRYPKTLDELTAYHSDQVRFIRQAYKDPMNTTDGSWRPIYLLPNGQLRGSYMHQQLQGILPISGPLGGAPATATPIGVQTGVTGQGPTSGIGTQQPPTTGQPGAQTPSDSQSSDSPVFGGSLIGVASKIPKDSIRVYKLGTKYDHWEFFYDQTDPTGSGGAKPAATPPATQPPPVPGQPLGPGQSSNPQIDH